jgi:ribosomal protein S18 acetylase RimI-like enzyme
MQVAREREHGALMIDTALPIVLREMRHADEGWVKRSWAGAMRHSPWSRGIPDEIYWPSQYLTISQILAQASTIVAVNPHDTDHLYASCTFGVPIAGESVLHWVEVKAEYRQLGIASALLLAAFGGSRPIYLTQPSDWTSRHQALLAKHGVVPSPYVLLGTHTTERDNGRAQVA